MKKKTITSIATLTTALALLIVGYFSNNESDKLPQEFSAQVTTTQSATTQSSTTQNSTTKISSEQSEADSGKSKATEQLDKTKFPDSLIQIKNEGIEPFGYIFANVTKVVDGDTFHIKYDNQDYKVRMLDIDTPESVKSGVEPQPYSAQASDLTKETLAGKKIKLIFEKDTNDQFERLLAHVVLDDGTYYNAYMVQNGYAIAVFYSPNTLLKDYFYELQSKAIEDEKGFWQLPENKRPFIEDIKGKFVAAYKIKN